MKNRKLWIALLAAMGCAAGGCFHSACHRASSDGGSSSASWQSSVAALLCELVGVLRLARNTTSATHGHAEFFFYLASMGQVRVGNLGGDSVGAVRV